MRVLIPGALLIGLVVAVGITSCGDDSGAVDREEDASTGALDAMPIDGGVGDAAVLPPRDGGLDATLPLVNTCHADAGAYPGTWLADPHLCLTVFAGELSLARQMAFAPNGDLFVKAGGKVVALFDTNKDGVIDDSERSTFASSVEDQGEINHGLAFSTDHAWVYASNDTTVFRWPYHLGDHVTAGPVEIAVSNMPAGGGHVSRTLVFDASGRLYVNIGSAGDVDQAPEDLALRAQVRRFTLPSPIPAGGVDYATGEVFASGMRNEVGLTIDSKGRMWGVENGSDGVYLPQFGNITDDNPGEEINRLDLPGSRYFGHGFCWSEFAIDGGGGPKTQWAYWGYPLAQTDAWCRDAKNVQPPVAVMQAHWASLGVAEYTGHSLPWSGDLLVTSHGSSFRAPPVGRLLARAHVVGDVIQGPVTPIAGHAADGGLEQGTWDVRPVDVRTGPDGVVYFSDDFGHRIFRLGYKP